jgi:hypothetical protein
MTHSPNLIHKPPPQPDVPVDSNMKSVTHVVHVRARQVQSNIMLCAKAHRICLLILAKYNVLWSTT